MFEHVTMIGIAFVIWPVTKSLLVMIAAATTFWSRDERRNRAAGRILDAFGDSDPSPAA
ncbi:hypothetical protein [Actinoplanes derwentensis]|uniref:Uncharacterized protein n=1 Tax=Actinoplanes derwentensis TaxID=113562 RepID=A0A1H1X0A3_9ACTN|nr:hypothetical protein [Actinoplanes derwentensis]GID85781.1 hypothetical protein Ade03nite_47050 [Actinoplanes derwentensis]SDT02096.1 hypothetical protein SAMN04489716_2276 [Actinoplanes derwentensis]